MLINYILWNPNDAIFDLGFFALRYYSLFFMLAFASSYLVVKRQFLKHHLSVELLDKLSIYVFLGTLAGARLAHCLFYDFAYFSQHPLEILLPVRFNPEFQITGFQGLASHGGGLGIILSLVFFSRNYRIKLWFLLDQISLVVPLAGFFIRLGNLMNSEIIGKPTDMPWAFVFLREDQTPRHPAQLYEAISYLLIFLLMNKLIQKGQRRQGYYFGLVLALIFSIRFLIEFLKEIQSPFEAGLLLDMGQLLSIPFIVAGLAIVVIKRKPDGKKTRKGSNKSSNAC